MLADPMCGDDEVWTLGGLSVRKADPLPSVTPEVRKAIEESWNEYARQNDLIPKSINYHNQQRTYFNGAVQAIQAIFPNPAGVDAMSKEIPAVWAICLLSGRPIDTN